MKHHLLYSTHGTRALHEGHDSHMAFLTPFFMFRKELVAKNTPRLGKLADEAAAGAVPAKWGPSCREVTPAQEFYKWNTVVMVLSKKERNG